MVNEKRVTVSLLLFNTGEKLRKVIDSILSQSMVDFKLVITNNGRDLETKAILNEYKLKFDRLIEHENIGFGCAHNLVIDECNTEFILIMNDDVLLSNNYLESCIAFLKTSGNCIGCSGEIREVSDLGSLAASKPGLDFFSLTRFRKTKKATRQARDAITGIVGSAAFFKAGPLKRVSPVFDPDFFMYFEDVDLCWRLYKAHYRVGLNLDCHAYHLRSYSFKKRKSLNPGLRKLVYLNRYYSMIKNEKPIDIIKNLPFLLFYEFLQFSYLLLCDPGGLGLYFELIKNFKKFYLKRKAFSKL